MKKIIIAFIIIVLIGLGVYFITKSPSPETETIITQDTLLDTKEDTTLPETTEDKTKTVIGSSVDNRDITAYHYGTGDTELLFVGGIHGGYEWNTALVAYELMDYLQTNPTIIPENVKVTVIPVLNPDGLNKTTGTEGRFTKADIPTTEGATISGRFNANNIDLNRNFDCDWQEEGTWQNKKVDGGSAAFSEPESQAIQNYVTSHDLSAVVVWYSSANGVFASSCHDGVLAETNTLTNLYAQASSYPAYQNFDFYAVTGDMVNWLAKEKVPAISVLLSNHTDTEWSKNEKGVKALLEYYAK